jgi:hypothetical protein
MAVALSSPPEPGQLVSVRSRHWVVGEVDKSTLPPPPLVPVLAQAQHLVSLLSDSRNPNPDKPEMAGVLIYTAAPDSEGTLGGLVSLGEPSVLERHLNQAMDSMRLCSSDPLCAEHHPGKEGTSLHGASCHACLFAPETSCERGNKYLDRTVLVPTVDRDGFAFFLDLESDATVSSSC